MADVYLREIKFHFKAFHCRMELNLEIKGLSHIFCPITVLPIPEYHTSQGKLLNVHLLMPPSRSMIINIRIIESYCN